VGPLAGIFYGRNSEFTFRGTVVPHRLLVAPVFADGYGEGLEEKVALEEFEGECGLGDDKADRLRGKGRKDRQESEAEHK
jgi:hypothetical protein